MNKLPLLLLPALVAVLVREYGVRRVTLFGSLLRPTPSQRPDIDLLVVATVTPDMTVPAVSCIIQHKLGIRTNVACFDLNAACSGFIYALDTASAMLASGAVPTAPNAARSLPSLYQACAVQLPATRA